MRISDWSSDVCSSDLVGTGRLVHPRPLPRGVNVSQPAKRISWSSKYNPVPPATVRRAARRSAPALRRAPARSALPRSEEHTSELQSLMRNPYAAFCLKKKKQQTHNPHQLPVPI